MKKIIIMGTTLCLLLVVLAGCSGETNNMLSATTPISEDETVQTDAVTPMLDETASTDTTIPSETAVEDVIEQMAGHWIWHETNPEHSAHVILFADGRWEKPPNFSGSFWIAYEESGIYYLRLAIEHSSIPNVDLGFEYEDYIFDAHNNRFGMIVHSGEGTQTLWFTRK